jgi:hypothetical protein
MKKERCILTKTLLPLLFLTASAGFGIDLDEATKNAINTVIASPAMQNYQFTITPGCRYSVIDAMYFCNSVEAKDSYSDNSAYNVCVSSCKAGCDACCSWWDGGKCKNSCSGSCSWMKITGSYDFRLDEIAGVGGIRVTQVSNMGVDANNANAFSITLAVNVPTTVASIVYDLQQSPLPPLKGTEKITATNTPGTGTGQLFCDAARGGYYVTITSLTISAPQDITDTSGIFQTLSILGYPVQVYSNGIVDLKQIILNDVAGQISKVLLPVLNDLLKDVQIAPSNCAPTTAPNQ